MPTAFRDTAVSPIGLMSRIATLVSVALLVAGCSGTVSGNAVTSLPPSNTSGKAHITFDPCKDVPASVIKKLQLDRKPPRPDTQSDGDIENVFCRYSSQTLYYVTIAASNYTLDMLKEANNLWGYQEFDIGGRKALFGYRSTQPKMDSCALNIAATTGVYGVLVGTADNDFSPYPDCLTAARKNAEALVAYFPL